MASPSRRAIEWPTVGLIALAYGVTGALVYFHASLPWWALLSGAWFAALQSSLQHEVLHGHPTRWRVVNELLVFPTLHFWLPYGRYRDTHLAHHNDANVTDPRLDPESYYMLPEAWAALPGAKRALYTANHTLAGRMVMGPLIGMVRFWSADFAAIAGGDRDILRQWGLFALSAALTLSWIIWCGMPVWQYLVLIAYPGISLALVRSFCEHQAAADVGERTIIVEASPFWSLLFLNNNLHLAHHARPALAWYRLPAFYRSERTQILARNRGYLMHGYGEIFRRYFFRPKEPVAYPDMDWLKSGR